MNLDDKQIYVAGIPFSADERKRAGLESQVLQPNSVRRECGRCHHLCWIGPKGQKVLTESPEAVVICANCAQKLQEKTQVGLHLNLGKKKPLNGSVIDLE